VELERGGDTWGVACSNCVFARFLTPLDASSPDVTADVTSAFPEVTSALPEEAPALPEGTYLGRADAPAGSETSEYTPGNPNPKP